MAQAIVTVGGWWWGGHRYRAGETVAAPPAQIAAWAAAGYVASASRGVEQAAAPVAEVRASAPADPAPEWPHKMAPEKYLNRFPEGPDAELARLFIDKE